MSILKKPYKITVWEDVWDSDKGKFIEQRIGIIGADSMQYQGRAIEPNLTRNANGTKKFTFKMYKRFIDNVTGKTIDNPFSDWLISERKVKLYYNSKWYDFVVKNISETTDKYLYSYQLEDALVQELSKNGFGVILDDSNNNNSGNVQYLAEKVLEGTDWTVEAETFVQTIEESLVYLQTKQPLPCYQILDQKENDLKTGCGFGSLDYIPQGKTILGFYSSCTNKPYRFQFIYIDDLAKLKKDDHRIITNKDCQYYFDIIDLVGSGKIEDVYKTPEDEGEKYLLDQYRFSIPSDYLKIVTTIEDDTSNIIISGKYRGKRIGFTQQSKFIPQLNKYVNIYQDKNKNEVYGYLNTKYQSPTLIQNVISGYDFSSMSGWTGSRLTAPEHRNLVLNSDEPIIDSTEYLVQIYELTEDWIRGGQYSIAIKGLLTGKDSGIAQQFGIYANGSQTPVAFLDYDATAELYRATFTAPLDIITNENQEATLYVYNYADNNYDKASIEWIKLEKSDELITSYSKPIQEVSLKFAEVENLYGYFQNDKFYNSIDVLSELSDPNKVFTPYLQLRFKEPFTDDDGKVLEDSVVINSCIYDNRISVGKIEPGEEWVLKCKYLDSSGNPLTNGLNFSLGEYIYSVATGGYVLSDTIEFTPPEIEINGEYVYHYFKVESSSYDEKTFKKNSQIRLCIQEADPILADKIYYLENIELFKAIYREDGSLILPDSQGEEIEEGVIDSTYYYFSPSNLDNISDAEELKPDFVTKQLEYSTYIPVFNNGAEKIRSVSAKESNYFNILQSIAETFEAWLDLEIKRDDFGGITEKIIRFKNYLGSNNYAGFRYGVNLKSIKRTHESKKIVTKLIVKDNKNEFAKNGFCTISRAGANPTGENYIYDFQYFHNNGLLNARDYIDSVYSLDGANGKDIDVSHEVWNINGYFPRIKNLNNQIEDRTNIFLNISKDLLKINAELEVAKAGYDAATTQIEEERENFRRLTNLENIGSVTEELKERDDVKAVMQKYIVGYQNFTKYEAEKEDLQTKADDIQLQYDALQGEIQTLTEYKKILNKLFYQKYSRFIQEGTWISEEYNDDEKYFADALSTMYNSCYPQVAYTFDVLELSQLPGYEGFAFGLGDKTFAEDPEFFGSELREEVVITEIQENLDDPSKNKVKVQNYKNQFQDLFQKITATTQSVQYNTGSYEKAAALAEATQERKQQFFSDALNGMNSVLQNAGNQTVTWGADGITITKEDDASQILRLVSGAILFKKDDKWVTGITSEGISANLITAGQVDTGRISIMDYKNELFRWDKFGITAFTYNDFEDVTSGLNKNKFVRFDQYGIYGINNGVDGTSWHVTGNGYEGKPLKEIDSLSTFALTWEGLKVTGSTGGTARVGRQSDSIIQVKNASGEVTFKIDEEGNVSLGGNITWAPGSNPADGLDVTINRDAIYGALETLDKYPNDGIYNDGSGNIAINATAIKAGALNIGGTEELKYKDARFYADVTNNKVYLSGWTATNAFLYNSDNDNEGTFSGISKYDAGPAFWAGANGTNNIDSVAKFYVSHEGIMHAESGDIAGWEFNKSSFKKDLNNEDQRLILSSSVLDTKITVCGETSDEWRLVIGKHFGVSLDGMSVTSGKIGGWYIGTNSLITQNYGLGAENSFHMYNSETTETATIANYSSNNWRLAIGQNFGVTTYGMYASSGRIGGFNINDYSLYANNFHILTGKVASNEPRIRLGETRERYNGTIFSATAADEYIAPVDVWEYFQVPINPQLYNRIKKGLDGQYVTWGYYDLVTVGSTTLRGESTLQEAAKWKIDTRYPNYIFICNCNSSWTQSGYTVTIDFTFTKADLVLPFCVTEGGYLHAIEGSFDNIISGKIGGWNVNNQGFFVDINTNGSEGFGIWSTKDHAKIALHAGKTSSYISSAPFILKHTGELYVANHYSGTSDLNKKKDISNISIKYEIFFDMIQPITFRFKENSSERIHTGFIAQQIKDALDKAEIDTRDFAGLVIEKDGEREDWYLRYGEFISLNTWQIQKLKPRMTAAEEKIQQLEFEITELKQELAALKNQ